MLHKFSLKPYMDSRSAVKLVCMTISSRKSPTSMKLQRNRERSINVLRLRMDKIGIFIVQTLFWFGFSRRIVLIVEKIWMRCEKLLPRTVGVYVYYYQEAGNVDAVPR